MMSRISRDLAAHHAHNHSSVRAISSHRTISQQIPKIAIIGAGFAGLRCADVLLRNGANVTIYEARNRVGGRVCQQTVGDQTFDMGPNWIHGTKGNPIMNFAESTGTTILEPEESQMVFGSDGNRKSAHEAAELAAETWATIVDAFKHSHAYVNEIDPQESLMDFFKRDLAKRYPNDPEKVQERVNEARSWGPFIGDPIDRQSLRNFFLEECLEGENVFVASSYDKILAEVERNAVANATVRLDEEVAKIEYRAVNDSTSEVTVTTARGDKSRFDEVVVTCPLGWLKQHKTIAFSPALPLHLLESIDNISYGHLEKVYITYSTPWWMGPAPSSATTNGQNNEIDLQSTDKTPLFIHFHHPTYHPNPASTENEYWNQSVINLALLPGQAAKPTLLFYMYGPCSLYMTSMIASHKPGSDEYNKALNDFLQPFVCRLPFYSADNPDCIPTSLVATEWSNDPYAGHGSYSNFQVGLDHGDKDIVCMRDAGGLSEEGRGLWLAGEHTAPFVAIGTTTGAYWSGEAVARRLLHRHGVENVETGYEESKLTI